MSIGGEDAQIGVLVFFSKSEEAPRLRSAKRDSEKCYIAEAPRGGSEIARIGFFTETSTARRFALRGATRKSVTSSQSAHNLDFCIKI